MDTIRIDFVKECDGVLTFHLTLKPVKDYVKAALCNRDLAGLARNPPSLDVSRAD